MEELGFLPKTILEANMTRSITRGEMCKIAVQVFTHLMGGYPYPDSTNHFTDTQDPDICFAYEQGIVSGYGNGKFGPNDLLTREQFFTITHNLMLTAYCVPDVELPSLEAFSDSNTLSSYAIEPTQTMVAIGVVKGSNGKLNPKKSTSCQEAIVMFFRAYEYMCQWFTKQTEENKQVYVEAMGYVGISDWAVDSVITMKEKAMIPGSLDHCNMRSAITREQMCSVAMLAYKAATGKTHTAKRTDYFTDTTSPDVCAAYELGIVSGYGNGRFGPTQPLTREQFFKIMGNFMTVLGYPRNDNDTVSLKDYSDGHLVADWAQAPTRLLIYIGAVMGDGEKLNPQKDTSIQEALTVFLRCYNFTANWKEEMEEEEKPKTTVIDDLLAFAKSYLGYPYVYGGNGPNSFDCSGFVLYCYKHFGYSFSRRASQQYNDGVKVSRKNLKPGDLVFFSGSGANYITHVGLYLGNGEFIHAANPSRGVVLDTLQSGYYDRYYYGACRIITD
jgi:hypothetical protein